MNNEFNGAVEYKVRSNYNGDVLSSRISNLTNNSVLLIIEKENGKWFGIHVNVVKLEKLVRKIKKVQLTFNKAKGKR